MPNRPGSYLKLWMFLFELYDASCFCPISSLFHPSLLFPVSIFSYLSLPSFISLPFFSVPSTVFLLFFDFQSLCISVPSFSQPHPLSDYSFLSLLCLLIPTSLSLFCTLVSSCFSTLCFSLPTSSVLFFFMWHFVSQSILNEIVLFLSHHNIFTVFFCCLTLSSKYLSLSLKWMILCSYVLSFLLSTFCLYLVFCIYTLRFFTLISLILPSPLFNWFSSVSDQPSSFLSASPCLSQHTIPLALLFCIFF